MNYNDLIQPAIDIATKAHEGQFRFDNEIPYIEHPKAVAAMFDSIPDPISRYYRQSVAWLHDTIEDSSVTADDLRKAGIHWIIIEAVVAMTKLPGEDYDAYLIRVKANDLAREVKIRDILHNLGDSPTKNMVKKYAKALLFLLS
jgi:(p)ppGpp synthase/HD superfamily hydrolase